MKLIVCLMIRSSEKKKPLKEAQWRTLTGTLRICQNFYRRLRSERDF